MDDMAKAAGNLGLRRSSKKIKHMRMNATRYNTIRLNGAEIGEVTYLGAKMFTTRDSEVEIRARLSNASQAFASLRNIWKSRIISTKRKITIRTFMSNVLSTLLYGSESWMTKGVSKKLEVFKTAASEGF